MFRFVPAAQLSRYESWSRSRCLYLQDPAKEFSEDALRLASYPSTASLRAGLVSSRRSRNPGWKAQTSGPEQPLLPKSFFVECLAFKLTGCLLGFL